LPNYSLRFHKSQCALEIETLGSEGLRYRTKKSRNKSWHKISAPYIDSIKDSAGAGDWCSAGIIHSLGTNGAKGLERATHEQIKQALTIGQLLGALNCKFDGARGLMYNTTFRDLCNNIRDLSQKKQPAIRPSVNLTNQISGFSFEELIAPL